MAGRYILKKSGAKFMFNLKASNGVTIFTSQQYATRASAMNGIASVQKNCGDDARFERKVSTAGQPYFTLKAKNAQVIGRSQMYKSERSREAGIASVKANGTSSDVREEP